MSKIEKTICDKCNEEIYYDKYYYTANITYSSNISKIGEQICKGDFCKNCFKNIIGEIKNE